MLGNFLFFTNHLHQTARHPYKVLALCLLVTGLSSFGLLSFREEREMIKLWVAPVSLSSRDICLQFSQDAQFRRDNSWVEEHFPRQLRAHHIIFEADNVLEPAVLKEMARVRQKIFDISVGAVPVLWEDICFKVPIISKPKCMDKFSLFDSFFGKRRRRAVEDEDECANFQPPDLSNYSWTDLASIKYRMETEGFTPDLGEVSHTSDFNKISLQPKTSASYSTRSPTVALSRWPAV